MDYPQMTIELFGSEDVIATSGTVYVTLRDNAKYEFSGFYDIIPNNAVIIDITKKDSSPFSNDWRSIDVYGVNSTKSLPLGKALDKDDEKGVTNSKWDGVFIYSSSDNSFYRQ